MTLGIKRDENSGLLGDSRVRDPPPEPHLLNLVVHFAFQKNVARGHLFTLSETTADGTFKFSRAVMKHHFLESSA